MSAGFTPGPWTVDGLMVRGDDQYIARADMMRRPISDDGITEAAANAKLIAAAPDLYEALLEAADFVQPFNRAEGLLARIEAALAKARGEA